MATYDSHILVKVRNWAALKYSPSRIVTLLDLPKDEAQVFLDDIETDDHPLKKMYDLGFAIGEYNMDVSLIRQAEDGNMDAELQLRQRQKEMKIRELKKDLFGV
jgi:hypothetical protein